MEEVDLLALDHFALLPFLLILLAKQPALMHRAHHLGQMRLAHPGLAQQQDHPALARAELVEAPP